MKAIKKGFLIGSTVGIVILTLSHFLMSYLPNTGPLSFFSKLYHITWLLTGLAWNYNIQLALNLSAAWLPIYRVLSFTFLYGLAFGILGIIGVNIARIFKASGKGVSMERGSGLYI